MLKYETFLVDSKMGQVEIAIGPEIELVKDQWTGQTRLYLNHNDAMELANAIWDCLENK